MVGEMADRQRSSLGHEDGHSGGSHDSTGTSIGKRGWRFVGGCAGRTSGGPSGVASGEFS